MAELAPISECCTVEFRQVVWAIRTVAPGPRDGHNARERWVVSGACGRAPGGWPAVGGRDLCEVGRRWKVKHGNRLINSVNPRDGIWVEVETNKGEDHYHEGVKLTCSYRGLFSISDFNRILDHSADSAFVKLERVFWIDERRWEGRQLRITPIRFGHDGVYKNFLGPLFLRISQIVALAPIDGEKDLKWMEASITARRSAKSKKKTK
jgi:hypothetical protein